MIPPHLTAAHIAEAMRRIIRDGIPPRRRSRNHCLETKDGHRHHLPPKYTISLAHQVATGKLLSSRGQFHGGRESNDFLRSRGFTVIECRCRNSSVRDAEALTLAPPPGWVG